MVKMVLNGSDRQAQGIKELVHNRAEGYRSAIVALSAFNETAELNSVAYNSGKAYGMEVLLPLMKGFIILSESLLEGGTALPTKYRSEVSSESLDSEELTADIAECKGSLNGLRGTLRYLSKSDETDAKLCEEIWIKIYKLEDKERTLQRKLSKLLAYDESSKAVFPDVGTVSTAVGVGVSQIHTQFANFNGEFHLPTGEDVGWITTINDAWSARSANINNIKNNAANKAKESLNDATDQAYKDGVISEEERKSLYIKIDEALQKYLGQSVEEFVPGVLDTVLQDFYSEQAAKFIANYILPESPRVASALKGYIGRSLVKYGLIASIQSSETPVANAVSSALDSADDMAGSIANNLDEAGAAGAAASNNSNFTTNKLPTMVGAVIDFGIQIKEGEDVGDALVKTAGHTAIGATVSSIAVGFFGGPVGILFGAVGTYYGSETFDKYYESAKKEIGDAWENFTDAVEYTIYN